MSAEEHRESAGPDLERPPDVVVRGGDTTLELKPYTYCWGNGCADGFPPEPPPDIGTHDELTVEFPVEGWDFAASFQRADNPCGRTQTIDLEPLTATTYALPPAGLAGTYDVDLFGKGDGDLFAQFRWTTTTDGQLPEPNAHVSVLADNDGAVGSYGVELNISNLAESPDQAEAIITVTAANGNSMQIEPPLESPATTDGCDATEGHLFGSLPEREGLKAAELGEPPFTYAVDLVLDGRRYQATATWPDDVIPDYEPYVSLTFDPPLPALTPAGG